MTEIPLPEGWVWKKLGEVAEAINPGFPTGKHNNEGSGKPHLRPMNVNYKGQIDLSVVKYVSEGQQVEFLKAGDILFNNTNSPELVGKTAVVKIDTDWYFSNHMTRVRVDGKRIDSGYVATYLHYLFWKGFFKTNCVNHVNQASIGKSFLSDKVNVPLPPLPVQRAIVARIEELFSELEAGERELQTALTRLKTYRQAVLHHYLNNPDWEQVKLGEVIMTGPQNGLYKSQTFYGSGTRIVRIDNFYDGVLNPEGSFRRVQIDPDELALYKLNQGDILVNRVNSMSHIGKCALVKELNEGTVFESNIMRLALNARVADPRFVVHFLTSPSGLAELRKNAKQAVNQASINQQDVKGVEMYLPDLATQTQIVSEIEARLSEADALETTIRQELARAANLRQSILKRAFAGQLVTAPADGPASLQVDAGELAGVSEPIRPVYGRRNVGGRDAGPPAEQLTLF